MHHRAKLSLFCPSGRTGQLTPFRGGTEGSNPSPPPESLILTRADVARISVLIALAVSETDLIDMARVIEDCEAQRAAKLADRLVG
jgi:hypothetical protein